MKVLMLGGDEKILLPGTEASRRFALQQQVADITPIIVSVRTVGKVLSISEPYDVVTPQDPFWRGILALWVAWRTGAKLSVQVHAEIEAQPWYKRLLAGLVLKRATSIRVVSHKLKKLLESQGINVPIHVLPVYVDVERFRNIVREPHQQKTILWIGRLEEEKNPLFALSVFNDVRSVGINANLIFVGDGSLLEKLKQNAEGLPVEFPGWGDPLKYFTQADVVLSTSHHESWGASIVEALAAGVPVVAPDVGIAKEAGAIVVPRSELSHAIIKVLKDGKRGTLHLTLPNAEEWAAKWKDSL
jgi:glycosyltransferase involved in cell wall biosynthesis